MKQLRKSSLLEVLMMRLGRKPSSPATSREPLRPFQAISIHRGVVACAMARKFSEHRFLAKDAPPLPLSGCTMSATCQCRYLKHRDRRGESRRLADFGVSTRLFDGRERRARGGRRKDD
jgi:hypothetical protein